MTDPILLFGVPFDFVLFALTSARHRAVSPAHLAHCACGLGIITAYKLAFTGFKDGAGLAGLGLHLTHEFSLLANLFLLLTGLRAFVASF